MRKHNLIEGEQAEKAPIRNPEGATPMMQQYLEIKAVNADSLLFYRMGDFYELFFEDAEIASRTLGITLTKRGKLNGEEIPMCGVPFHAADDYLQKLIGFGHRVAVCEQMEDPAEAKKRGYKAVVRRDVTRLVTPGTITEEKLLDPSEANYLMALGRVKASDDALLALAWIDISTGIFRVTTTTADRLHADISRIEPRELIVADPVYNDEQIKPVLDLLGRMVVAQPSAFFDSATAVNRLSRFYGVATLDGFGQFSRAELSAISGAVAYVEKTQIAERPPLGRPERDEDGRSLFIDPATRSSLELVRTLSGSKDGSLLRSINRSVTGAGSRLLAERLMSPLTDAEEIKHRLDGVSYLLTETDLRDGLRQLLRTVPDISRALSRIALNRGGPRDMGGLAHGLEVAEHVIDLFGDRMLPEEVKKSIETLKNLPSALVREFSEALAEDLPLLKREGGFVRAGYNGELDELRDLRDQSRRVILGMEQQLIEESGIRSLKIRHNNILGYYIEVTANNAGALTDTPEAKARFIHRQTMANAMRFTTTELAALETKIANAADQAQAIELGIFEALVQRTIGASQSIQAAAQALAALDVSAGLACLAEQENYCRPVVDNSLDFHISGGRHPVVEQSLRAQLGTPFVANDCDLSPVEGQANGAIWLLTGPNMGGKSTFLRQNALIAVMAQMGSYVPAASARIGIVDRLFSRVGASDDLARGRSTFMVEMVETAAILNQASERSLVILDEIGRGTSTFDGLSIAWAAVEYLHETNQCRSLFATHFHEMTALSEKLSRLANVTMRVKEYDGDVIFLHEVAKGAADRSYGIQVARLAGLPHAVVERARDVLNRLEQGQTNQNAARIVDDLPLFAAASARQKPEKIDKVDVLREEISNLNPDNMSPREALEAIYKLKNITNEH